MAAPKRSSIQRVNDYPTIAKQYLQGIPQAEIAKGLGISQQQICKDLAEIRKQWIASSVRDFDEAKSIELAKIDLVEAEFWKGWEASTKSKTTVTKRQGMAGRGEVDLTESKVEKQIGNPAFLQGVMSCIQKRCQIMGLDSEIKMQELNSAIGAVVKAGFRVEAIANDSETDTAIDSA